MTTLERCVSHADIQRVFDEWSAAMKPQPHLDFDVAPMAGTVRQTAI